MNIREVVLDLCSRKPETLSVREIRWARLQPSVRSFILDLPKYRIKDFSPIKDLPKAYYITENPFIVQHKGKSYYVDTQGYDYPRYIAELKYNHGQG